MYLPFHRPIAPGLFQRCPHRGLISSQSRREPSQFRCCTVFRLLDPTVEFLRLALPEGWCRQEPTNDLAADLQLAGNGPLTMALFSELMHLLITRQPTSPPLFG